MVYRSRNTRKFETIVKQSEKAEQVAKVGVWEQSDEPATLIDHIFHYSMYFVALPFSLIFAIYVFFFGGYAL